MKKVVLAYSGGLDTTYCVKYLGDLGYEVHAVLETMNVKLDNARLLGPLMKQAQKAGLIEPVVCGSCNRQETRLSRRKKRHAGPQYLWRTTPEYYYEYWKE